MSAFEIGDRVLVTLSGVDVPATIAFDSQDSMTIDVRWTDQNAVNAIHRTAVRFDPTFVKVEVGTVLYNPAQLKTITKSIVLVDNVSVAGVWERGAITWAVPDNDTADTHAESVSYPATIVAVLR